MSVRERPAAGLCQLFVNETQQVTGNEEAYVDTFKLVCSYWEVSRLDPPPPLPSAPHPLWNPTNAY